MMSKYLTASTCRRYRGGCVKRADGRLTACLTHDTRLAGQADGVANVLAIWHAATDAERANGARWYAVGAELAVTMGGTLQRGAGVIAALSPQMGWTRNMVIAATALERGTAKGFHTGGNVAKADAIAAGADPMAVLGGDKVRNFYQCFLVAAGAADGNPACIDRHAIAIYIGRCQADNESKVLDRKGVYDAIADAYRSAADVIGVPAYVMQAVTWVAWRRMKGIID